MCSKPPAAPTTVTLADADAVKRDGAGDNGSWNCGAEAATNDPAVERMLNLQVKKFPTVTLLSLGVPMILV